MVLATFVKAARSVASCLLQPKRERPKTLLRSLCIAAFDFAARVQGQRLGREKRKTLARLLDLGALINDHFDQYRFRDRSYRHLRKLLTAEEDARAVYLAYFRDLRRVERNRPRLRMPCQSGLLDRAAQYREDVVRLSLLALAAIALGPPSRADVDDPRQPAAEDSCLPHLFALVMLLQLCDDLLDWRNDWRDRLPSFATAALLQSEQQADGRGADVAQVRADMQRMAAAYLAAMPRRKSVYWPFALCTYAVVLLIRPLSIFATRGMQRGKRPTRPLWRPCCPFLAIVPSECRKDAISLED
jgi:hypothetical protein